MILLIVKTIIVALVGTAIGYCIGAYRQKI